MVDRFYSKIVILGLIFISSSGCGLEADFLSSPVKGMKTVIKASKQLIASGEASKLSYMVAFRSEGPSKRVRFSSYLQEYQTHYLPLIGPFVSDSGVRDIHFITSVNLTNPDTSFQEPEIEMPRSLRLNWDQNSALPQIASIARVDFRSEQDAHETLDRWEKGQLIWFAEPNYISKPSGLWEDYATAYAELGSWYATTKISEAYQHLEGVDGSTENEPIIAVMDSGVDVNNDVFQGTNSSRIWTNDSPGSIGCGKDDFHGCNTTNPSKGELGNGDIAPFNLSSSGSCPVVNGVCQRECCHGTHVAGIIAALPGKMDNTAGSCPVCRIMALRIVGKSDLIGGSNDAGTILDSSIAGALKYVALFKGDSRVRIINSSFGKFHRSRAISVLVRALRNTPSNNKGAIIIGAAGNEDSSRMQFPAAFPDAIAVANLNSENQKHPSSNFGRWVDVSAPGTLIYGPIPGSSTPQTKTGTSMAAPVVAGIAGLLIAAEPNISVSAIQDRIVTSSDPSIYQDEVNTEYLIDIPKENISVPLLGSGMINAENLVNSTTTAGRPIVSASDRVKPGCGVLGKMSHHHGKIVTAIFLGLPLALIIFTSVVFRREENFFNL